MPLPQHGSNPSHLLQSLGMKQPKNMIDFSVNVNPFGMPASVRDLWGTFVRLIEDYPDPTSKKLRSALAAHEGIDENNILIGNGAAELIFLLANVFRERDVLIVDPTFSEYRTASETFGCRVHSFALLEENDWQLDVDSLVAELSGKNALFLCNPNNPTGVRYDKQRLLSMIEKANELAVTVVIDEAFYDFCSEADTLVSNVNEYSNLVILRSFTKMFAIPGIRLGWLAASAEMISRLESLKPHWSVNAVAAEIGMLCLHEPDYAARTRKAIEAERERMKAEVKKLDFVVSNSCVNYYLLREAEKMNMQPLLRFLIKEGIVPRHTENFIGLDGCYLRLAVRKQEENDRLLKALESWRHSC